VTAPTIASVLSRTNWVLADPEGNEACVGVAGGLGQPPAARENPLRDETRSPVEREAPFRGGQ
jgi:hypothetical protein